MFWVDWELENTKEATYETVRAMWKTARVWSDGIPRGTLPGVLNALKDAGDVAADLINDTYAHGGDSLGLLFGLGREYEAVKRYLKERII